MEVQSWNCRIEQLSLFELHDQRRHPLGPFHTSPLPTISCTIQDGRTELKFRVRLARRTIVKLLTEKWEGGQGGGADQLTSAIIICRTRRAPDNVGILAELRRWSQQTRAILAGVSPIDAAVPWCGELGERIRRASEARNSDPPQQGGEVGCKVYNPFKNGWARLPDHGGSPTFGIFPWLEYLGTPLQGNARRTPEVTHVPEEEASWLRTLKMSISYLCSCYPVRT